MGLDVAVLVQVGLCVDQVVLDGDETLAAVADDLGDVAQDAPGDRVLNVDQDAFDCVQAGLGGDQGALGVLQGRVDRGQLSVDVGQLADDRICLGRDRLQRGVDLLQGAVDVRHVTRQRVHVAVDAGHVAGRGGE